MIQMQTILNVADNSGAKSVMCIKVLGGSGKYIANIGDIVKVSVKQSDSSSKIKKGEVYTAVVVRTKTGVRRSDGSIIRFGDNAVVLLSSSNQMIGTRVSGPVTKELREHFMKIISLAPEVL